MNIRFFQTQCHTLSNGMVLVYQTSGAAWVSHFGYMVGAGARQDPADRQGVAHLLEHLIFKGTAERSSRKIFETFDSFGSELNGYTAKEETCYYFSVPSLHFAQAAGLLIDMLLHPQFLPREIQKEKNVITDEILSYHDSPSDLIFDDFEALLYGQQGIGQFILGTEESLSAITREDILDFYQKNYKNSNTVLSYIGGLSFENVVEILETNIQSAATTTQSGLYTASPKTIPPLREQPLCWILPKSTNQTHCMIGRRVSAAASDRLAFEFIHTVLGGGGLSSLLNLHIREKYGYVYTIESQYTIFSDDAYFGIYFGTDQVYWRKVHALALQQMARLADKKIAPAAFERQKNQLKGLYILQNDNSSNWMIHQAKQFLLNQKITPIDAIFEEIEDLDAGKIQALCAAHFDDLYMSTLVYLEESLDI